MDRPPVTVHRAGCAPLADGHARGLSPQPIRILTVARTLTAVPAPYLAPFLAWVCGRGRAGRSIVWGRAGGRGGRGGVLVRDAAVPQAVPSGRPALDRAQIPLAYR
jgi:hypothetical protein